MLKYHDYITDEDEDISTAVAFYLDLISPDKYRIKASSKPLDELKACPISRSKFYWPMSREQVTAFFLSQEGIFIFDDHFFSFEEIERYFSFEPNEALKLPFGRVFLWIENLNLSLFFNYLIHEPPSLESNRSYIHELKLQIENMNLSLRANADLISSADIQIMLDYLNVSDEKTHPEIWAILILISKNPDFQEKLARAFNGENLLPLLQLSNQNSLRSVLNLMMGLSQAHLIQEDLIQNAKLLQALVVLLENEDKRIHTDALGMIKVFVRHQASHRDLLLEFMDIGRLLSLIQSTHLQVKDNLIDFLGLIAIENFKNQKHIRQ